MLWTNFCSFLILIPFCFLSGDFFGGNAFIPKHPEILPRILAFCLCSVAGQYFIFLTIKNFGPLTVSIITTCRYFSNLNGIENKLIFRKFFSVLFSVFIFGNVLTVQQWVGAIIVFSGLVVDIYFGEHWNLNICSSSRSALRIFQKRSNCHKNPEKFPKIRALPKHTIRFCRLILPLPDFQSLLNSFLKGIFRISVFVSRLFQCVTVQHSQVESLNTWHY